MNVDADICKTIEESSFETLEALVMHVGHRLLKHFLIPEFASACREDNVYPRFKISLAKPTAVTFADAPVIELLVESDPEANASTRKLWEEYDGRQSPPPFPLEGRLDDWIENDAHSRMQ